MRTSKSAFSLIEILIALAILGLGIAALFNIFPAAWQAFAYSRILNRVSVIAQQKLEELKSGAAYQPGATDGEQDNLKWRMTLAPVTTDNGIRVTRVELDVMCTFQGIPQKQRFVTYIQ